MSLAQLSRPVPVPAPLLSADDHETRKRTSSFSFPRPAKLTRHESLLYVPTTKVATTTHSVAVCCRTLQMYKEQKARRKPPPLTRSGTVLSISTSQSPPNAPLPATPRASVVLGSASSAAPPHAPLASRSKAGPVTPARSSSLPLRAPSASPAAPARSTSLPISRSALLPRPAPSPALKPASRYAPSQVIMPSAANPLPTVLGPVRSCSPLVPPSHRASTPSRGPRPLFPRARAPLDLYRAALRAAMAATPEGRRVLLMGARLAVSIEQATRELEKLVEGRGDGIPSETREDDDIIMGDDTALPVVPTAITPASTTAISPLPLPVPVPPILTASWVVVHPGSKVEDWEMVDCAA